MRGSDEGGREDCCGDSSGGWRLDSSWGCGAKGEGWGVGWVAEGSFLVG